MTNAQAALYRVALRLGLLFGTGGAAWTGRRAGGGSSSTDPTITSLASATMYFLSTALIRKELAAAGVEVFSEPYVCVPVTGADCQPMDYRTNGSVAFLLKGKANSALGFDIFPADMTELLPALNTSGGFRSPLWILGVASA